MGDINKNQHKPDNRKLLVGILIFVVALALRIAYVNTVIVDHPIRADAAQYLRLAYNLVYNDSFSLAENAPFTPSIYRTPGYPIFLAIGLKLYNNLDSFYKCILNTQALLDSFSVLFIYIIGIRMLPLAFAILAGLLAAISPHLIAATGYLLTETLFTFFLSLTAFVSISALKNKNIALFALTGLCCALSALIRPVMLLYPVALLFIAWRILPSRINLRFASFLLVGFMTAWGPWQIWKTQNFNPNDVDLMPFNFAFGIYPDLIYKDPKFKGYVYREDPEYDKFSVSFKKTLPVLFERAKKEPSKYLKWYLWDKPKMFWQADNNVQASGGAFIYAVESSIYHKNVAAYYSLFTIMEIHPYLIILCMGATAFFLLQLKRNESNFIEGYICVSLIVYFTLIHTILTPLPRYSYPVIPYAYLLACFTIFLSSSWIKPFFNNWRKPELK